MVYLCVVVETMISCLVGMRLSQHLTKRIILRFRLLHLGHMRLCVVEGEGSSPTDDEQSEMRPRYTGLTNRDTVGGYSLQKHKHEAVDKSALRH